MISTVRRLLLKRTLIGFIVALTGIKLYSIGDFSKIVRLVQQDLYPPTPGVPTLEQMNAAAYLETVLHHSKISESRKRFIKNGAQRLNEEALLSYQKPYVHLLAEQRQAVLRDVAKTRWGENWIHAILTYMFEAMLGDPVYGGNVGETGWKWLEHTPGLPRPTKAFV